MTAMLVVGEAERERVVITVLGRSYPDAHDYWDGNWLRSRIDIRTGAWRAEYEAALRVEEFIKFRRQLEVVHRTLQGQAHFASMELWLDLTVKAESAGHITVEGAASDLPGSREFTFTLSGLDQSHLPPMLDQLRAIEDETRLRGGPDA